MPTQCSATDLPIPSSAARAPAGSEYRSVSASSSAGRIGSYGSHPNAPAMKNTIRDCSHASATRSGTIVTSPPTPVAAPVIPVMCA